MSTSIQPEFANLDRTGLPSKVDVERAILGSIFLNNDLFWAAADEVTTEDFYLDSHRRIWSAVAELGEDKNPIDPITVCDCLQRHDSLEAVGGIAYISGLTDGAVRVSSVSSYVKQLKESTKRRKSIRILYEALQCAQDLRQSTDAVLAEVHENLLAVAANNEHNTIEHASDIVNRVVDRVEEMSKWEPGKKAIGLTYGFDLLDELTTGIAKQGEMVIWAGYTSHAKTSSALQIAAANCEKGVEVAIMSIEQSKDALLTRMLTQRSQVSHIKMRDPRDMMREEIERVKTAAREISKWPLYVDDRANVQLHELLARMRLLRRRDKIKLFIIDYLQLIYARGYNRKEQVTRISHSLKDFSKTEGVPLIVLSQLSRPIDKNTIPKPRVFMLKESGDVECDADVIVFSYRHEHKRVFTGKDLFILAKQREGPTDEIPVYFDGRVLTYRPREIEEEKPVEEKPKEKRPVGRPLGSSKKKVPEPPKEVQETFTQEPEESES